VSDEVIAADSPRAEVAAPVTGGDGGWLGPSQVTAGRLDGWRSYLQTADRRAVLVLVLTPVILNVPFALAGHPLMASDNLTQNYPLRVLAGQMLAHGRLPLWDPQIWSGTPLLAGWNAGALYPGTWLFALVPGVVAYEVNVVSLGIVAGVGSHIFLRRQGCSPVASFLGALTFTYTGFMSAQSPHLGLVEGMAFAPVVLLAIDGLARSGSLRAGAPWVALIGLSCGLVVLAGDPRAISNVVVLGAIFTLAQCWRAGRRASRLAAGVVTGGVLAAALSAVQWLPGLSYLSGTQRSGHALGYFGAGSLGWHDLAYLFVPYVIGGNGTLGGATYAGPFNLIELTIGVGLVPLVALAAFTFRLIRPRPGQRLGVWFAALAVSAVLCAGTNLPTGRLLVHLPLFGGERLQNRNAGIGDFALSVILALFVDALGTTIGRQRVRRALALLPCLVVVGLVGAVVAEPGQVQSFLGSVPGRTGIPGTMAPYYAVMVAIALATAFLVLRAHSGPDGGRSLAAKIVVTDVAVFILFASYQPVPPGVLAAGNSAAASVGAALGGGRQAILDPGQYLLAGHPYLLDDIGLDDLVILRRQFSVSGYGAAVSAAYEAATGAHEAENLRLAGFLTKLYDELDLRVLVAVPEMFGRALDPGRRVPLPAGPPAPPVSRTSVSAPAGLAVATPPTPSGPWRLGGRPTAFELPGPVRVSSVTLVFEPSYGPIPRRADVTLSFSDGRTLRLAGRSAGDRVFVAAPRSASTVPGGGVISMAVGITAAGGAGRHSPVLGAVAVVADSAAGTSLSAATAEHRHVTFVLDGPLQGVVSPATWRAYRHLGPLVLLANSAARGPAWLEAPAATSAGAAVVPGAVTALARAVWQDPVDLTASRTPVLLVRSETFAAGWSVTARARGGRKSLELPVRRVGLLQGVVLPAGEWQVTWHYRSPGVEAGLAAGAGGIMAAVALAVLGLRRRSPVRSQPGSGAFDRPTAPGRRGRPPL
jgi:hypothetical protein